MPRAHADTTQKRHRQINIRVTDGDHTRLSTEARQADLKLAVYCECVLLRRKIEIAQTTLHRMDPALFAELRRIGNNLNQVAHAINSGLPPHLNARSQGPQRPCCKLFSATSFSIVASKPSG